jgi:hypothetical protein
LAFQCDIKSVPFCFEGAGFCRRLSSLDESSLSLMNVLFSGVAGFYYWSRLLAAVELPPDLCI